MLARRTIQVFLASLLVAGGLSAQTPAVLPPESVAKIEAVIRSEMARQKTSALSVAIAVGNQIVYAKGFGLADVENAVAAKATTVYRVGSVAKPITAVVVLQLAEQGKLDLDAPIQEYCPAFPEKPWPVTARQLLGHLGGVRHYKSQEEFDSTHHYEKLVDGMAMFKDDALVQEPGTAYHYSTFGYVVLGCAVEGASGMRFMDYVENFIFAPAGMSQSGADDVYAIILQRARGYHRREDGEVINTRLADTSNKVPGGGMVSTPVDLAKFALALESGLLLKPETLRQMWTRQKTHAGEEIAFGLGWSVNEHKSHKVVGHSGGQQGARSHLLLLPGRGIAIALMSNTEPLSYDAILQTIADLLIPAAE